MVKAAPDITTVVVNGDAATGGITFTVTAPGFLPARSDELDREVIIWLDTDKSGETGDPEDGTEYGLAAGKDSSGRWWDMGRWNGSDWEPVVSPTTGFSRTGDVLSWTVSKSDLGGTTGFRFYVFWQGPGTLPTTSSTLGPGSRR